MNIVNNTAYVLHLRPNPSDRAGQTTINVGATYAVPDTTKAAIESDAVTRLVFSFSGATLTVSET